VGGGNWRRSRQSVAQTLREQKRQTGLQGPSKDHRKAIFNLGALGQKHSFATTTWDRFRGEIF